MSRQRKNRHIDDSNDGIVGYILASFQAKVWLAITLISLFAILGVGVVLSTDSTKALDASKPFPASDNVSALEKDNQVNTSQLPDSSFIYDVSIEGLASADTYLDGQTVQVVGEVIGDRIHASENNDYSWITLQSTDQSYSEVSVYMPDSFINMIDSYGKYGTKGTVLQVRGTFNLACVDHQGANEIHAEHVSLVSRGEKIDIPFSAGMLLPGLLLIFIGAISMLVFIVLQERQR